MANTTARFGANNNVGTTYVILGAAVPASTTWNVILTAVNRSASPIKIRGFVADTSWASGEPTSTALKAAFWYDTALVAGQVTQISFIVMNATEKIVVRSDTANSLDIMAAGIAIT